MKPHTQNHILKTQTTSAQLYTLLRQRIIDLRLKPGSILSRRELAEEYGVSPMPLREAIAKLTDEGLIEIHPQSRTLIATIDIENVKRMHFLRTSVELEVARVLAEAGSPMREARDILVRQERALLDNDLSEFSRLDRAFHRSLHAEAGFEELWDLVIARSGHVERVRNLNLPVAGRAAVFLNDHKAMVAAIASGSVDAARDSVRQHLSKLMDLADQARAKHPSYFS